MQNLHLKDFTSKGKRGQTCKVYGSAAAVRRCGSPVPEYQHEKPLYDAVPGGAERAGPGMCRRL